MENQPKKSQTPDEIFAASKASFSEAKIEAIRAKGYALTPEERQKLQKEGKSLAWEKANIWSKEGVFVSPEERERTEQRIGEIDAELALDEPKQMHEIELKLVQSENTPPGKPISKADTYHKQLLHGNPEEVAKRKKALYEGNPAEVERKKRALFGDKE